MMKKTILTTALMATFGMTGAMAEKPAAVGAMTEALTGGAATIGRELGSKGKGTASAVSGGGNGGWGNVGSAVVSGEQVSNRQAKGQNK